VVTPVSASSPIILTGRRALLVPLEADHGAALFETARQPGVWDYMPTAIERLDQMERFVESALAARAAGTENPFVIVDQETGQVVGSTRYLDIAHTHRNLEIGFTWLAPQVWRTRINTECKYLLLRHAFETLNMIRVQFKTDARNVRSQNAIERIGGVREGVLRSHRIMPDGYLRDSVYFSILAPEWPKVKERLEAMLA
jgi:N-acetyltransferase